MPNQPKPAMIFAHVIAFTTVTQHWDRGWNRTNVQIDINPFINHPAHERLYTPPTLYEQQCGFFYVPQESEQWKSCDTGPLVSRPYSRRLECLTICWCHNKGSTFSSVILRPWARPGFQPATSRLTDGRFSNWANRTVADTKSSPPRIEKKTNENLSTERIVSVYALAFLLIKTKRHFYLAMP